MVRFGNRREPLLQAFDDHTQGHCGNTALAFIILIDTQIEIGSLLCFSIFANLVTRLAYSKFFTQRLTEAYTKNRFVVLAPIVLSNMAVQLLNAFGREGQLGVAATGFEIVAQDTLNTRIGNLGDGCRREGSIKGFAYGHHGILIIREVIDFHLLHRLLVEDEVALGEPCFKFFLVQSLGLQFLNLPAQRAINNLRHLVESRIERNLANLTEIDMTINRILVQGLADGPLLGTRLGEKAFVSASIIALYVIAGTIDDAHLVLETDHYTMQGIADILRECGPGFQDGLIGTTELASQVLACASIVGRYIVQIRHNRTRSQGDGQGI